MTDTPAPIAKDRQDAILDAAFHAFATYGYRRTSMDDIARGAGLSRTALYLHYRNKEDIFRSLATRYFHDAMRDMQAALDSTQDTEHALTAAMAAKDGKFMEVVLSTPHGQELLDAGFSVTGDIAARAEDQMGTMLAAWLARRGVPPDAGTPEEVAGTILATLKGLKSGARSLAEYRAGQARLARIIARAIG